MAEQGINLHLSLQSVMDTCSNSLVWSAMNQGAQLKKTEQLTQVQNSMAGTLKMQADEMAKIAETLQWVQLVTGLLTPLALVGGGVAASAGVEGLASMSTFNATVQAGTSGTMMASSALNGGYAIRKGQLEKEFMLTKGMSTNAGAQASKYSDVSESETGTQRTIGQSIASAIGRIGRAETAYRFRPFKG